MITFLFHVVLSHCTTTFGILHLIAGTFNFNFKYFLTLLFSMLSLSTKKIPSIFTFYIISSYCTFHFRFHFLTKRFLFSLSANKDPGTTLSLSLDWLPWCLILLITLWHVVNCSLLVPEDWAPYELDNFGLALVLEKKLLNCKTTVITVPVLKFWQ